MMLTGDLPDTISVFPLPGALLLPRARLPLHLFEPRYLQMLEDCLKTPERLIGMVQPLPSHGGGGAQLQTIGCVGRVTQFSETEDGRYLITLTGISRFRLEEDVTGFSPYCRCRVSWSGFERDLTSSAAHCSFDREMFMDLLSRYFDARSLSADWETLKDAEDELLINSLSMMLDFDLEDKQALLEASTLEERCDVLVALMEFALRGGCADEVMQ